MNSHERRRYEELSKKMVDAKYNERKMNEQYVMDAEVIFLQFEVLKMQAQNKLPETSLSMITGDGLLRLKEFLYESSEGHICDSRTCNCFNMRKGTSFVHPITQEVFKATGLIYVCQSTGLAHHCGENRCNALIVTSRSEGVVCKISGMCFETVMRRSIFSTGSTSCAYSCEMEQDDADILPFDVTEEFADDGLVLEDYAPEDIPARNSFEHAQMIADDKKRKRLRARGSCTSYEYRTRKRRKRTQLTETQKKKRRKATEMKQIEVILRDVVFPPDRETIIKTPLQNREKEADAAVAEYYKKCQSENKTVLTHELKAIHARHTLWAYELTFKTFNPHSINFDTIDYFRQCIIHLLDIMSKTPYGKKNTINFRECVVSLIYMLKEGFSVPIYIDNKGMTLLEMPVGSDKDATPSFESVNVELIPRHPYLTSMLVPTSGIQRLTKSTSRATKGWKQSNYRNVSFTHGVKEIKKCYQSAFLHMNDIKHIEEYMLSNYIKIRPDG